MPDFGTNQSDSVETLSNKTLITPIISSISNAGTLTLPTTTSNILGDVTSNTIINKAMDALTNNFSNLYSAPHVKEIGGMTSQMGSGALVFGIFGNVANLGTQSQTFSTTHGYFTTWTTTASTTVQGGLRQNTAHSIRAFNPYYRCKFNSPATTNNRVWIGFTSNTTVVTTDTFLGTTDSGLGFGYRSTDANWSVFHNNGGGSAMTVVSTGIAKDTAVHAVDFQFSDSVPNCVVRFYGSGGLLSTTTPTTALPASTTQLFIFRFVGPSTAAVNTFNIYNEWYEHTRTTQPL